MKTQRAVQVLCWLIVLLSLCAAGTGVLWQPGGAHFDFTTLHGQAVT